MQLLIHFYLALSVILVLATVVCVLLDILLEKREQEKANKDPHSAKEKRSSGEGLGQDRAD